MVESNGPKSRPLISVVSPAYNEEINIAQMYERLAVVASQMPQYDFEFVFVDDCSTDRTPKIMSDLRDKDDRVMIIRFARNFGAHEAVTAGLNSCRGDGAVVMASDLQDPPEKLIPKMAEQWEKGFKVVWGVREKREGEGWVTLFLSRLFYFLTNLLTDVKQPSAGADVYFLDRIVIDAFNGTPEKNTSVIMLIAWLGFRQTSIN
ncbi:MAG: glycosyltransferase family 2 protein [Nitrospinota bacterium]|nr:glycosyltransferase family 2 protein [Nitrospinota bacterium]